MDRNYLKGPHGDAVNAVLAGASYDFRRVPAWLRIFLRAWLEMIDSHHAEHRSIGAA
jgi:IS5 family transposase